MDVFSSIKQRFKQKDLLIQIILINVAIFLVLGAIQVVSILFKFDNLSLIKYIGVSSNIDILITRPWTLFTYMIVHQGIWHLAFNMLLLYWFGQLFLSFFTARNLGSLYILGGLAGALLYILTFNTIPYYLDMGHAPMIGASASVTAIIFATAFYRPQQEVRLFIFGGIKIIYIALFIFIIDFISLGKMDNPGGHVAHIGGAILGYIYAKQYLRGKDITAWLSKLMDGMVNLFKKKPKKKVKMKPAFDKRNTDYTYNEQKNKKTENIDHILDKIKSSGYSSLTKEEKKSLFDASRK